jgi:glycosyltransferase involved in cell wall biosynthesis
MSSSAAPLVSVVIPVYNGEQHVAEAIRSVLAQTYTRFDLTVLNNASTDGTLAIAESFAARDPRVRVCSNPETISVVANHNKAFTVISDDAKYVKILGADDWLFPHCLEEMVRVAEAHPSVGMVTSYVLSGPRVAWDGLPYPSTFMPGREVCRLRLLKNIKVFGGPSASLIRADIVRAKRPFYNPLNYHGDTEAYLELLQHHDFGYVHQVLTYNRTGEDSRTTSYLQRVNSYPAADLDEITKFGPIYLTPDEHAARLRAVRRAYYRFLGRAVLEFRGREFWDYHLRHVAAMGYRVDRWRVAVATLSSLLDMLLNPKRTVEGAIRRLRQLVRPAPAPPAVVPPQPLTRDETAGAVH